MPRRRQCSLLSECRASRSEATKAARNEYTHIGTRGARESCSYLRDTELPTDTSKIGLKIVPGTEI